MSRKESYSFLHNRKFAYETEKRFSSRKDFVIEVSVLGINDEKDNFICKGIDISSSGVGFISEKLLKSGDILDVVINLKNQCSIPVLIKVIRVNILDQGLFIGAEFIGVLSVYSTLLHKSLQDYNP